MSLISDLERLRKCNLPTEWFVPEEVFDVAQRIIAAAVELGPDGAYEDDHELDVSVGPTGCRELALDWDIRDLWVSLHISPSIPETVFIYTSEKGFSGPGPAVSVGDAAAVLSEKLGELLNGAGDSDPF